MVWSEEQILEYFPRLKERMDIAADYLSGGEQQMVAVARAMSGNVRLLLLDEPFEGLAPAVILELFKVFDRLRRHISIVIVEHNLDLVLALADRVFALERGAVFHQGPRAAADRSRLPQEDIVALTSGRRQRMRNSEEPAILVAGSLDPAAAPTRPRQMTIAVFTKNLTNPAYEAFRIAADQIARATDARIVHFVPNQPDNVDEQKAMVEQVLKDRPDAVIFIPVDDVAMIDSVKKLNEAKIPIVLVSNPLPGSFVTYVGADDYEIGYREARYLFENLGGKGKIVDHRGHAGRADQPRARARLQARASPNFPASRCSAPASATTSSPTPGG